MQKFLIFLGKSIFDFIAFGFAVALLIMDEWGTKVEEHTLIKALVVVTSGMAIGEFVRTATEYNASEEKTVSKQQLKGVYEATSLLLGAMPKGKEHEILQQLEGTWKSRYPYHYDDGGETIRTVNEQVEICVKSGIVMVISDKNLEGDNYKAWGNYIDSNLIFGHWQRNNGSAHGCFWLTIDPTWQILYGVFTGDAQHHVIGEWTLVRGGQGFEQRFKQGSDNLKKACRFLQSV